jgi:hypothetical protein
MKSNVMLWIAQVVLALLFLFAGGMKLVLPLEAMTGPVPLPGAFLRFLGVAEVLGAVGLVLPRLLHIRPGLTPLAAAGLTIIMGGATAVTAAGVNLPSALFPMVVGVIAASVAYGRGIPGDRRAFHGHRAVPCGERVRRAYMSRDALRA